MAGVQVGRDFRVFYAGAGNVGRWEDVYISRLRAKRNPKKDGYPALLLVFLVPVEKEDGTKTIRELRADRLLSLIDKKDGKEWNVRSFVFDLGFDWDITVDATPLDACRFRTSDHEVIFSPETGGIEGWVFHVPQVFRVALDLTPDPVGEGQTQGLPPAYGFDQGDVFYDSPLASQFPWGEALQHIGQMIQVEYGVCDQVNGLRQKQHGVVRFKHRRVREGKIGPATRLEGTQDEFVEVLRSGDISKFTPRKSNHGN